MKSITLTLLSSLLSLTCALGQSYYFSQSAGPYADLTENTALTTSEVWDDPQLTIPIGFDFTFYDTTISTIYLDDWGYGAELSIDTSEIGTYGLLIPYGSDIMDRGYTFTAGGATASQSTISYKLEGSSGSRVLKIEWKNVGFYSEIEADDLSTDFTNFQLWLFEGSNNIEMHYGPNSITQPVLCYEGETGTYIGMFPQFDFDNEVPTEDGLELSGKPDNAVASTTSTIYENYMDGVIPNGTIYKFSMSPATVQEPQANQVRVDVHPNPAHDQITVSISNSQKVQAVEIITTTGSVVLSTDSAFEPIDISELAVGVYLVNVSTENSVHTSKLMKK